MSSISSNDMDSLNFYQPTPVANNNFNTGYHNSVAASHGGTYILNQQSSFKKNSLLEQLVDVKKLFDKNTQLSNNLELFKSEMAKFKKKQASILSDLSKLQSDEKEMTEKFNNFIDENDQFTLQLKEFNTLIENYEEENDSNMADLAKLREENQRLNNELNNAKNLISQLQNDKSQKEQKFKDEIEKLQHDKNQAEQSNASLNVKITELTSNMEKLQKELNLKKKKADVKKAAAIINSRKHVLPPELPKTTKPAKIPRLNSLTISPISTIITNNNNNAPNNNNNSICRGIPQKDSKSCSLFFSTKPSSRLGLVLHKAENEGRDYQQQLARKQSMTADIFIAPQNNDTSIEVFVQKQDELAIKWQERNQNREIREDLNRKLKERDKQLRERKEVQQKF